MTASASVTTSEGADAIVHADGSAAAELLDYSLSVSRAGAPAPKRKGMPGVVIDESKDEWIDEDGVGHGQSRYSYKERVDLSGDTFGNIAFTNNPITLSQLFVANPGASWSSNSIGT